MIEVKNLHVTFSPNTAMETQALCGADLKVEEGEFVTVIGSNGAGKSTLLAAIAGDIRPQEGRIFIDGKDVTGLSAHKRAGDIARVFQDPLAGTCASISVEENMSLAADRGTGRGWQLAVSAEKRRLFRERICALELGLEDRLGDLVGRLSGGQRQAVSLIMATLAPSRILLLDEHTAALDPRMSAFVLRLSRRIGEEYGLTMLMVTHSMKAALSCGSRTIMLNRGKIVLDVAGQERQSLQVSGLLRLFTEACGEDADDDRLLLAS
ncbi:MAG: ABC transporter ATP-binding protein [Candidatus Zeuxoniibacter abyssi]|nr:MAG: ABC transporter ATP-binding protein [Candidatus Persebacteraceae bacterium AB1(2)]